MLPPMRNASPPNIFFWSDRIAAGQFAYPSRKLLVVGHPAIVRHAIQA
jgi:hypothetical protein